MTLKKYILLFYLTIIKYSFIRYIVYQIFITSFYLCNLKKLKKKNKTFKTGFVTNSVRFRSELSHVNKYFNFVIIPAWLQNIIAYPLHEISYDDLFRKDLSEQDLKKIKLYLCPFILMLRSKFDISFQLSPSVHYLQDTLYMHASKSLKLKVIVMHRENFGFEKYYAFNFLKKYYEKFKPCPADLIFVYNKIMKNVFENKVGSKSKIVISGSSRGFHLMKNIQNLENGSENKKTINIAILSFIKNVGLFDEQKLKLVGENDNGSLKNLFFNVHNFCIDFARKNKNIKLTILPKWTSHFREINDNWKTFSNDELPPNCELIFGRYYETLLNTDIFIAFGPSPICEAGILEKPIIVPFFDEAKLNYQKNFNLRYYERFLEVWKEKSDLDKLISKVLNEPTDKNKIYFRKKNFYKYICGKNINPENIIKNEITELLN